eukprot:14928119-Heterocapsa_arctica.AAC.1
MPEEVLRTPGSGVCSSARQPPPASVPFPRSRASSANSSKKGAEWSRKRRKLPEEGAEGSR